jgi:hypothetical protein
MATKIFFDLEFTGLTQHSTPVSLGMVSEDEKEFYAEFTDFDLLQVDDWLEENVISKLNYPDGKTNKVFYDENDLSRIIVYGESIQIRYYLEKWLSQFDKVEIWGDCLAYDWVLFCQLFGGALNLPKNVYYIPFDICVLFKERGIDPDIDRLAFSESNSKNFQHNSLADAYSVRNCYNILTLKKYK